MITIQQCLELQDGAQVDAVEGLLKRVYERKAWAGKDGATTIQNCILEDAGGNQLRLSAWGHQDLKPFEGFEVVVMSGGGGKGLKIRHGTYKDQKTVELSVSRSGQFQKVDVWKAQNGSPGSNTGQTTTRGVSSAQPEARAPKNAPVQAVQVHRGDKVGMAIKAAVDLVVAGIVKAKEGESTISSVKSLASEIINISTELEQGK